jgi:hypothetical protein
MAKTEGLCVSVVTTLNFAPRWRRWRTESSCLISRCYPLEGCVQLRSGVYGVSGIVESGSFSAVILSLENVKGIKLLLP